MNYEIVYISHKNSIDLLLKNNSSAVDLASVSAISVTVPGAPTILSDNSGTSLIRWAQAGYATGEIRLTLGVEATARGLTEGNYDAAIVVYDGGDTAGIYWGTFPLRIVSQVETT